MHRPRCLDLAILCGLAATAASQDASITDSIAISLQSPLATDTNLSPPPPLTSFSTQSSPTMSSVMPSSTSTTPTPNLCSPIKGSTICDSWEKSFVDYTTLRSGKWPNANKDTLAQGDVSAFDAWASTLTSQVWYPSPFDSDVVLFASGCFRQKPVIRYPTSFLCAKVVALDSSPQVNNKTSGSEAQSFIGGCRQNGPGTVDSQPPSLCPGPCMAYVDTILDALSSNADCLGLGGSELQRVKATLKQSCDRMQQQSQAHSLECKMGNSADLTTCGFGNRTMAISYCTKNAGDSCCGFANLLGTPTSIWTTTTIIAVVGGTLAFIAVLAAISCYLRGKKSQSRKFFDGGSMRWGTKNLWKTPQKKTVEVSRTGMGEHMGKITVATGPISNITVDDSVTSSSSSFLASTKPGYPGRGVPMMSDRINLRRMSSVRGGRVPLPQPPEETILPTPVGVVTPSSSVMLPTDSVRYKATQAYQTMDPEEVELSEGDIVQLDTIYLDGWSKGLNETTRQFGFIPFSVLRPL